MSKQASASLKLAIFTREIILDGQYHNTEQRDPSIECLVPNIST